MQWTPLPKGEFTGIDWSRPAETNNIDPYLVWAETDRFSGYRRMPPSLPIIIELQPGKTIGDLAQATDPEWLAITPVYLTDAPAGLRYCTAQAKQHFFSVFRDERLAPIIARFELGLPAGSEPQSANGADRKPSVTNKLTGKVMGLIDGGLAFANAKFLRAGMARTRFFWRQDIHGVGRIPEGLGYGHELSGEEIDAAMDRHRHNGMVDEASVYNEFELADLRRLVNHGTHVMDIACGPRTVTAQMANLPPRFDAPPSWEEADDDASRCPIVAVQLDWNTVLDTSGGSMNVQILDALMYILSRCDATAKVAVNISWGTLAGPHDGSSILEAALDDLIGLRRGRLEIIVPAGNSYQSRTHANDSLQAGEQRSLTWCVQADDHTQSFVEVWIAAPAKQPATFGPASIRVTPPGCAALPWMTMGQSGMWTDGTGKPLCALIFPDKVATGTTGTSALLALAPSASFEKDVATAPCGYWTVEIRNDGVDTIVFDAYVERDDVPIGTPGLGGRQSYFIDALYDTSGNPGSFIDHPDNPTLIRRSGNFNSISTGARTRATGGTRISDDSWALYSPRDPDPDHARPGRPGVVKIPRYRSFSDQNAADLGLPAAGTMSASVVRLVGTSSAAPQITRATFNKL
jgi:hypothetical protein